jgi:hypothetical protein
VPGDLLGFTGRVVYIMGAMPKQRSRRPPIIGCGTGRSGTMTLARILAECRGLSCTHEMAPLLPWQPHPTAYANRLSWLRGGRADVASSYLPYLRSFITDIPDVKIIVTRRDPDEVARSFETLMENPGPRNHWFDHHGDGWEFDPIYDPVFPKYDIPDRFDAIIAYANDYDTAIDELATEHPDSVLVVPMQDLGERATQRRIFEFAGIPASSRRYNPGAHHGKWLHSNPQLGDNSYA